MSIRQISSHSDTQAKYRYNDSKKIKEDVSQDNKYDAVVYEPDHRQQKTYQRDQATINRLIEEVENNSQKLKDLVEKMLIRQGQAVNKATDIYALLREGKVKVDPKTRAQAQKDIGDDGYWGIEQTSERLLSFAKALSGGDPSKADLLIEAVKKGFSQAEKAWGGELPQLCKDTLDRTISKMESWRDSLGKDQYKFCV